MDTISAVEGMNKMRPMIEAAGLTKIYDRRRDPRRGGVPWQRRGPEQTGTLAVDDVTFDVAEGELFVVMGLSGSGKSTLLRMLNRLVEPTRGQLKIGGVSILDMPKRDLRALRNKTISMVFQHFALLPHRTVLENAAYGLKVRGVNESERRERAQEALDAVGLTKWGGVRPDELSGGMRQRVGLARALATNADILLMDEPFSALDPLIRRDMQDLLLQLQGELKRTIVFVTHDLNEAMRLGQTIMVMRDGKIVQRGTASEILASPADDYVANFVADVDRARVVTARTIMRPPLLTANVSETPADVLSRLENAEAMGVFVTDKSGRILGVVRDTELATGVRTGQNSIARLLTDDYAAVTADAKLADLFHLVGMHSVPLAVCDEQNQLLGVISRAALLTALATHRRPVNA